MLNIETKWIRSGISLSNYSMESDYLITIENSGDLVVDYKKYADWFFNGAEKIIHYLSEEAADNQDIAKLDLWYFAMLYLYRQSLELLLKSTFFKQITNNIDRKKKIGIMRHDLKQGLDILLCNTPEYNNDIENENIKWLRMFFYDISKIDKESDMFRYPFGNTMQTLFDKQTHISLIATHNNMNKAYAILNNIFEYGVLFFKDYDSSEPKLIIEGGHYYQQSVIYPYHFGSAYYPYFTSYEEVGKFFECLIMDEKCVELFFPMCYIFRNAVELGLKRLIVESSHIPKNEARRVLKRKKHSLLGLWNKIEEEIEQYSNAPNEDTTLLDAKKYIQSFHDFDNSSDIFRYPTNKKLETYFLQPKTFDMLNIAGCFHELCNFLDSVASMFEAIKDYEAEMMSYYAE